MYVSKTISPKRLPSETSAIIISKLRIEICEIREIIDWSRIGIEEACKICSNNDRLNHHIGHSTLPFSITIVEKAKTRPHHHRWAWSQHQCSRTPVQESPPKSKKGQEQQRHPSTRHRECGRCIQLQKGRSRSRGRANKPSAQTLRLRNMDWQPPLVCLEEWCAKFHHHAHKNHRRASYKAAHASPPWGLPWHSEETCPQGLEQRIRLRWFLHRSGIDTSDGAHWNITRWPKATNQRLKEFRRPPRKTKSNGRGWSGQS